MTICELDTLLTALYVRIDDHLRRMRILGRPLRLTNCEVVWLAVAQVLSAYM
ncbi:hypothetical protein [Kitasatospora sp. NPDC059673]|uniref:hypothetical protein n=1 Tax=Kitasatospora sp. NPDC059673 TaxID=3346901 RepID=UPI0036800431